jgi:prefoldin alpha subunit
MSVLAKANTEVDITKIPPQQLQELGKAIDEEIKQLSVHYSQLVGAVRKFKESQGVLAYMEERAQGKEVMVPLTSSLYVPGRMDDNKNVLIECGAGYFIEKDTKEAHEYCDRKSKALIESYNKVRELIDHKKMQMGKVQTEFNGRMAAMQAMQKGGQ